MMRVSPPEEDRELPGPHASSNVTRAHRRRRYKAVHPPNAPAPITATWDFVRMLLVVKDNVWCQQFIDLFVRSVAASRLEDVLRTLKCFFRTRRQGCPPFLPTGPRAVFLIASWLMHSILFCFFVDIKHCPEAHFGSGGTTN